MTGATGDLTPDDVDRAFEPGERREVADPTHHADVTRAQAGSGPATPGEAGQTGASTHLGGDEQSEGEERF
jgi:hypothetical protein